MAITTLDGYIAAVKRRLLLIKTASATVVAATPFSTFDRAGNPGAGTLAIGNTANGVVPTDATAGYPAIPTPSGTLYLSRMDARNSVACILDLYDCLFSAGAYAYNADTTLASQPSYSSRLPNSGDYTGLEIWIEAVTAFTGNQTVQINYLDQDGNAGDSGAIATGLAPIIRRMLRIDLAAGDSGVQQITRVRSSVSTVGTFNVHVMRYLASFRINNANQGGLLDFAQLGLPMIFGDSALRLIVTADGTAQGLPALMMETADG